MAKTTESRRQTEATWKAAQGRNDDGEPTPASEGPTVKDKILAVLRESPAGVDVKVIAKRIYGNAEKVGVARAVGNLYKLARAKVVSHDGPNWRLLAAGHGRKPATKAASTPTLAGPTLKEKLLAALKASPSGADLKALAKVAYGSSNKASMKRCESYLYTIAKSGGVTHSGQTWKVATAS